MTTAVETKKTRAEICYEAVEAYKAENPGTNNLNAIKALAGPLDASVSAISQAYYLGKKKAEGTMTSNGARPRPRKRHRAPEVAPVTVAGGGSLVAQIEALMKRLEDLDAREADLAVREQRINAFEAALRAAQA